MGVRLVHLVEVLDVDCLLGKVGGIRLSAHAVVRLEIAKAVILGLGGSWSRIAKDIIESVCSVLLHWSSIKV